jgi:Tol biopolymer transport system component/Flp pilus assembly protein TadD
METGGFFSISRDNKRLFYSRELRYSNLWSVDLGGVNTAQSNPPKQLTTGTLAHFAPSFSPDGKKIVFSIAKAAHANLFVMPVAGGQMQQLTFMEAFNTSPAWSPDGQEIAFASKQEEKSIVMKIKTTGGQPQPFRNTKISSDLALTWSPGQDILYLKPGNRNYQKLNPQTQKETPLVENESVGWIFFPSYSPDGKSVALWRNDQWESSQTGLWIISLQDSSQKLLQHAFALYPITWSEESQWIYAFDSQKSPHEILKISAIGDENDSFFTLPVDEVDGLTMTLDGKQLVYAAVEKKSDVWFMEHFDPENELEAPFKAPDSPDLKLLAYWEKANNLRREKKYTQAEKVFREGLERDPDHRGLMHDLGWCLNNDKKYGEAEEVFRDGMARYPEDSGFYNGLGWSLNWQKKYAEAQEVFRKGLEFSPEHGGLLNGIRWAAFHNKNYESAKRYYNEEYLARGGSPASRRSVHPSLGSIGILLEDYDYAEKNFRKALAIDSTNLLIFRGLGYQFGVQNSWTEAEKYAWQSLGLDSSFANTNLIAWVLVSGEIDLDRGIAFAEQALAAKPENWAHTADVYSYYALPEYTLGLAYLKKGDYEKAVQYLEQAAVFAPERQAIREDLQRAREKLTQK